jgi:hypothetical protein
VGVLAFVAINLENCFFSFMLYRIWASLFFYRFHHLYITSVWQQKLYISASERVIVVYKYVGERMSESKGLFGKKSPSVEEQPLIDNSSSGNLNRRMRVVEERFLCIQKKQQVTEENMMETSKDVEASIKSLTEEVALLQEKFSEIRDRLQDFSEQLDTKASENEFLVFKKYLELWKPVNFVTVQGVETMIDQKLKKLSERGK